MKLRGGPVVYFDELAVHDPASLAPQPEAQAASVAEQREFEAPEVLG